MTCVCFDVLLQSDSNTHVFLSDCQDESHDSAVLQESESSATCENLLTASHVYFMLLK